MGPGLGRNPAMQKICKDTLAMATKRKIPVVIDADGLYVVQNDSSCIHGNENAVLTPNVMEFGRLCKAMHVDQQTDADTACERLSKALGGVAIVQKGAADVISNGETSIQCTMPGSNKRAGGQGDTLSGTLATLLAWRKAYHENLWEHDQSLDSKETILLAAYGAACVTRHAAHLAFKEKGRAMIASDLITYVGQAYKDLLES